MLNLNAYLILPVIAGESDNVFYTYIRNHNKPHMMNMYTCTCTHVYYADPT